MSELTCEHQSDPRGRWKITIKGGPNSSDHYADLMSWAKGREAHMVEVTAKAHAFKQQLHVASAQESKPKNPRPSIKDLPTKSQDAQNLSSTIFELWHTWYSVLKARHSNIPKPLKPSPEDLKHINTILEYGKDISIEIFKIAVLDWEALKSRYAY